jgi:hypothetical protein
MRDGGEWEVTDQERIERLNPDRDAVWRAVASGLKTQTINTPLVDQITNAVMDLLAQSSAEGGGE